MHIQQFSGCDNPDVKKCRCNLKAEFKRDNFAEPLVIGSVANPKAHLRVQNNGDEPSYDASLIIKAEALLKNSDVKGCKSLTRFKEQVS